MHRMMKFGMVLTAVLAMLAVGRGRASAAATATTESTCQKCFCSCLSPGCSCQTDSHGATLCLESCFVCRKCLFGVAGGGAVQLTGRQATVALLATESKKGKKKQKGATGLLRWVDPDFNGTAVTFESVGITSYGPVSGQANVREIAGAVRANGGESYPFRLLVDVEPAGGQDALTLDVGDAVQGFSSTGFSYSASGPLVVGDLVDTQAALQ